MKLFYICYMNIYEGLYVYYLNRKKYLMIKNKYRVKCGDNECIDFCKK